MYLFKYICKRLVLAALTFVIILTICFVLVKLLPNELVETQGKDMELLLKRREMLGYDKPIMEQYGLFWKYALQGDFGASEILFPGRDVWDVVIEKIPYTISLNIFTSLISVPVGIALGILAALKKNKWQDQVISTGVMVFISVPSFIYAFLVQYVLYFKLGWFPATVDAINGAFSPEFISSAIPAILSLSFGSIAYYARNIRAELTEVLTSDFMLLARTKGLTKGQATVRHALRNAMVPIFPAILGEIIGVLFGSLIIEPMFGVPGIGTLYVNSVQAQPHPDYNFFLLLSAFFTAVGLVAGIISDISYSIIDPRIRMGAR